MVSISSLLAIIKFYIGITATSIHAEWDRSHMLVENLTRTNVQFKDACSDLYIYIQSDSQVLSHRKILLLVEIAKNRKRGKL